MAALDLPALRVELASRGFSHVRAMAGPIPLESWDPYGMEGVNRRFFGGKVYRGELVEDADGLRVRDWADEPVREPFCLGCWEPMRLEEASHAS